MTTAPGVSEHRPAPTGFGVILGLGSVVLIVGGAVMGAVTNNPTWGFSLLAGLSLPLLLAPRQRALLLAPVIFALLAALGLVVLAIIRATEGSAALLGWCGLLGATIVLGLNSILAQRTVRTARQQLAAAVRAADQARVIDSATELANRRGLELLAGQIYEAARRRGDAVYCIFLDIDGLDIVNTRMGQAAGDDVLRLVATAVSSCTRGTDVAARWGDDEFVVVGPGTGLPPLEMERRVRAFCREKSDIEKTDWPARISAGGAVLEPWDEGSIESLLGEAEREMRLRRTLRRESAAPSYRPVRHDPSPKPPETRR